VQSIYSRNFQTIPLLIVAAIWYLALTSMLSVGQSYLERYYERGSSRPGRDRSARWYGFDRAKGGRA
jgi:polar amino acid transport system permease protein